MAAPTVLTYPGWMQAGFWISYIAWSALEVWVWMRERRGPTSGQSRDRGSVWWIVGWVWVGVFAGFALHFSRLGAISAGWREWFVAGLALMWLGFGLRIWAIQTLGRYFRTWVVIQDQHRIVTGGPYRVVRNPAYSGTTLTMVGMGLAMLNWYSTAALLVTVIIAYSRRIAIEQKTLVSHFGADYEEYMRHTWALIPFLW